jgi:hypothetical protein
VLELWVQARLLRHATNMNATMTSRREVRQA